MKDERSKIKDRVRNLEVKCLLFAYTEPQAHVYKDFLNREAREERKENLFKLSDLSGLRGEHLWFRLV